MYMKFTIPRGIGEARRLVLGNLQSWEAEGNYPTQVDFETDGSLDSTLEVINIMNYSYELEGCGQNYSGDWLVSFRLRNRK